MSFRFQKRVSVAPGVRLNFSKRGISTTVGRQGHLSPLEKRSLWEHWYPWKRIVIPITAG
ncbi:DUF4236 domain-containing protein [Thalassobacillus sp. C254]|uniref:DUF4236 domain-containing protein n=1 Tax=Thalassobacillus sp. C254 TaxID=1225341 RepID=UPI0009FA2011